MKPQTSVKSARRLRYAAEFSVLMLVCLMSGCAKSLLTCPRAVRVPEPPAPEERPAPVFFATDRVLESREKLVFSGELNLSATRMSYGVKCEDPIAGHEAACTNPVWLKEELPASLEADAFFAAIRASNSDVVLFVHGFNYSFDESLGITLRMVERTGIQAIPVAYSWPSVAKVSAYGADYDRNEWTIEHLKDFIQDLVQALPPGAVLHIVAHSMGNRAVLWALARLNLPQERLGQLIMIAPDVDTEIFKDLVLRSGPFLRKTLYASKHDLALQAAGWLRAGTPRAGDARKQFVVIKEMDTIDASSLKAGMIGHSVYDYSQVLFDDLAGVLKDQPPPARNLAACTVKSIARYNATYGTQLPDVVYSLPRH
ncbi:MAG TPA: alpha/beta fold hydrolase [Candidatus Angelobacter sp.]